MAAVTTQTTMAQTSQTSSNPSPPSITHLDRVLYLFGHPIAHSLSPLFHGTNYKLLSLNYEQHLYETLSLPACLALTRHPKFLGASVTMPHKVAIIPHLDSLTPEGAAIGAINTIYWGTNAEGEQVLCGTNTDCIGIREAILRNSSLEHVKESKGKPGMVIGGGGTSRAAVYALKQFLGCSEIYLVNRDKSEVDAVIAECTSKGFGSGLRYVSTIAEAQSLEAPRVIVSAIPDFPPRTEDEIRTRAVIKTLLAKRSGAILEMCYHPSPNTEISALAKENGWLVIPGVEAMVWQGFEQDRVWLEMEVKDMPIQEVKDTIATELARNRGHTANL
jgi:quinate dehydrogenase